MRTEAQKTQEHRQKPKWTGALKDYESQARRITLVLFFSQGLSSAAFIAAFTVNALAGIDLGGCHALAGVPGAVYVVGQAAGALTWGFSMERMGRRRGIAFGQLVGAAGAATAAYAVVVHSFSLFLAGLFFVGTARAAVDLGRFAAAEVHVAAKRGQAISHVVLGSTIGAVAGPLLVGPAGRLAAWAGVPELTGSYVLSFGVLMLAAGVVFAGLRPDPRDLGRHLARACPESARAGAVRPLKEIVRQPEVVFAVVVMVFAQMVMMVPMSITSVHMKVHQHALTAVSFVISVHAIGMYAFSVFSGRATDRWGRKPVIILGLAVLILSCVMGVPSTGFVSLCAALFLLGLGWNLAYVAGSTLLADQLSPGERARMQGFNDLLLNLASAASQAGSGVIYAAGGFGPMCLASAVMAAVPLALLAWQRNVECRPATSP